MSDARLAEVAATIAALRRTAPLVHAITGTASQSIVADGLLAAGARVMMTDTEREAPTLVTLADGLLVNVGSLGGDAAAGIPPTVEVARSRGIPWVLDPAAIGIAPLRTPLARELLKRHPAAVRANASEVIALAGAGPGGRGPDSTLDTTAAVEAAGRIAGEHGCIVAVSGAVDVITDGVRFARVTNGLPRLAQVTGTGCLLGGLTAACLAATADRPDVSPLNATIAATAMITIAAEYAGDRSPGSFRVALLDALDTLDGEQVAAGLDLSWR